MKVFYKVLNEEQLRQYYVSWGEGCQLSKVPIDNTEDFAILQSKLTGFKHNESLTYLLDTKINSK
jgi:hypothetical protein